MRMPTIVTPELTLEPLLAIHADATYEVLSDQAIYRFLDYLPPASAEELRGFYARWKRAGHPMEARHG